MRPAAYAVVALSAATVLYEVFLLNPSPLVVWLAILVAGLALVIATERPRGHR